MPEAAPKARSAARLQREAVSFVIAYWGKKFRVECKLELRGKRESGKVCGASEIPGVKPQQLHFVAVIGYFSKCKLHQGLNTLRLDPLQLLL